MGIGRIAGCIGKGLVAGAVGTAAMTASSTIEAKLRDRGGSTVPADAAEQVLGVEAVDDDSKAQLANVTHWAYGTSWGAARGIIGALGLTGATAIGAHLALVWASELIALPRMGLTPPPGQWGASELGVDLLHHSVYAVGTGLAFDAIS